jgi:hypothetical protein
MAESVGDGIFAHSFAATIGGAPTGRGEPLKPPCPVHSYGASDVTQRRAAPSATFGNAPTTFGEVPKAPCPVHSYGTSDVTQLRAAPSATFGNAPTTFGEAPKAPCPVHSYGASDVTQRRAAPSATFGSAPTGRGVSRLPALNGSPLVGTEAHAAQLPRSFHSTFGRAPRMTELASQSPAPHAYLSHTTAQPFKHSPSATFGTSARQGPHLLSASLRTQPRARLAPVDAALPTLSAAA